LTIIAIITIILYTYYMKISILNRVNHMNHIKHIDPSKFVDDKIIWSYWDGSDKPLSVEIAIYTWRVHNPEYVICILSESTLGQYLDRTALPKKYDEISVQRKTDVIRLALLEQYGGIWLDSTIFLSCPLSIKWDPKTYDVGGYYAEFFTTDLTRPVLESWFISAPKNSPLIKAWKKEFYNGVDSPNYDDYIREMEKTVDLQKIEGKVYLMIHCCFLKAISSGSYNWKMFPAGKENGPFAYLTQYDWNERKAVWYLLTTKNEIPPVIKLRKPERLWMDWLIYYMRSGSIMDRLVFGDIKKNN